MPIYEFKCLKCEEFIELLVMSKGDEEELKCTKCGSQSFERVISRTNFNMAGSSTRSCDVSSGKQERTCSSGSCTTYTVPGVS